MKEKPFKTEADLCAAFIDWAKREGWTIYPETAGWDIVLVDKDGRQLGVEAKLTLNLKVISQALKGSIWSESKGPDFRAILVPEMQNDAIETILAVVGLSCFIPHQEHYRRDEPQRWRFQRYDEWRHDMHDWNPSERCALPDFIPDVLAGVPSPRTLSPWKVGALRVLARLELQGFVVRNDVSDCKNDPRRWCASDGWLTQLGGGRWGRADKTPKFEQQHPNVYLQILAEERERLGKGVKAA